MRRSGPSSRDAALAGLADDEHAAAARDQLPDYGCSGQLPGHAERLAFGVLFFIPECLPELADEELRQALQATMLRMLRVPS